MYNYFQGLILSTTGFNGRYTLWEKKTGHPEKNSGKPGISHENRAKKEHNVENKIIKQ